MGINLIYLYEICKNDMEMIKKLREWKLIPCEGTFKCPKCKELLTLTREFGRADGWRWYCNNKFYQKYPKFKKEHCGNTVEFRFKTFFARSKLSIFQILGFVNLWVDAFRYGQFRTRLILTLRLLLIGPAFVVKSSWMHSLLTLKKLAGQEKSLKSMNPNLERGNIIEGTTWTANGYSADTKGKVVEYLWWPLKKGTETLLPIIEKWIEAGTTIISDYWKAYDCLGSCGYQHLKVNHSLNFKDPETGAHTNSIESSWRAAKATMSSSGRRKAHIPGNLARYMFFKSCTERKVNRTEEFFRLAGKLYDPTSDMQQPEMDLIEEDTSDIEID